MYYNLVQIVLILFIFLTLVFDKLIIRCHVANVEEYADKPQRSCEKSFHTLKKIL